MSLLEKLKEEVITDPLLQKQYETEKEIYNIATTKLGMVYSQPGQTLYYSQNNDDYVVQYKDVPKAK